MKKSSSCSSSMQSRINDKSKLFKPGPFDVICGNTTREANFHHVGNRRFRLLVENHVPAYERAETRSEKATVVSSILSCIQAAGGGFVLRCSARTPQQSDDDGNKEEFWELLGRRQQREKVGQCLRAAIQARSDSADSIISGGLSSNRLYDVIGVRPSSFKAPTPNTSTNDATPESLIAAIASSMRPQTLPQKTNGSISRSPVLSTHRDSTTAGYGMEGALPPADTISRHHVRLSVYTDWARIASPVSSHDNGPIVLQTGDSRDRPCEQNPKEAARISTNFVGKIDRASSSINDGSSQAFGGKKNQHENRDTIVLEQLNNFHNDSLSVAECTPVDHGEDLNDSSSKIEISCEQLSRTFSFTSFPHDDGDPVDDVNRRRKVSQQGTSRNV